MIFPWNALKAETTREEKGMAKTQKFKASRMEKVGQCLLNMFQSFQIFRIPMCFDVVMSSSMADLGVSSFCQTDNEKKRKGFVIRQDRVIECTCTSWKDTKSQHNSDSSLEACE